MPIQRGEDWGGPGPLAPDGVVVDSDAAARHLVTAARRQGRAVPAIGLVGGDLCRSLGGRGDRQRLHGDEAVRLPCDVGAALLDGTLHWFVAHLLVRRSWWRGPIIAVMNAGHLGPWDVAPRAHPGDGDLDVVEADPSFRQRLQARGRLPSGTHVPHPRISCRRVASVQFGFATPRPVYLDGERVGEFRNLSVRVEPAALDVVV